MKTKMKSFQAPSSKPVDVEYRLRRALESVTNVLMFVKSVDPSALPEGKHADAMSAIDSLAALLLEAMDLAPKKRARKAKAAREAVTSVEEISAVVQEEDKQS